MTGWRRASACSYGNCVEVRQTPDGVQVRDRRGAVVAYDRGEWEIFLKAVRAGEFDLDPRPTGERLSWRHQEVLEGIAAGLTNAAIGRQLGITEETVKSRAVGLYRAIGARDRAHAVTRDHQLGILGSGAAP